MLAITARAHGLDVCQRSVAVAAQFGRIVLIDTDNTVWRSFGDDYGARCGVVWIIQQCFAMKTLLFLHG